MVCRGGNYHSGTSAYARGPSSPHCSDLAHYGAVVHFISPLPHVSLLPVLTWSGALLERLTAEEDLPRLGVPPRYPAGYFFLEAFIKRSTTLSLV